MFEKFSKKRTIKLRIEDKKKRKNLLIWCLIVFLFCLSYLMYSYILMPNIYLKNGSRIVIDYKEKYKEYGYKATFQGTDITNLVKISGIVNTKKLGTYKVLYTINYHGLKRKKTRKVVVVDKKPPVIKTKYKEEIFVCPGKDFHKEHIKAIDNYDGDISDKVSTIVQKDKVIYSVEDKSGNKTSLIKKIIYKDKEKPTITLEGGNISYAYLGESYGEAGFKAVDNCDGDITGKVQVNGNVNLQQPGEYTLTYTVSDKAFNETKVKRKVFVSKRGQNGTIYLTFDDGPKKGTTDAILDILKEENVKATFFVTGGGPDELITRAYNEGHTIGLHTYSHNYSLIYSSDEAYFNDLEQVQARVKNLTGTTSKIIRFPGGASNTISRKYSLGIMKRLTEEVLRRGYRYYDWNVLSGDAGDVHTKDGVYQMTTNNLSKERVNMVLMHDIKPYTRDALKDIIHYAKENGYTFEAITDATEMMAQKVNN